MTASAPSSPGTQTGSFRWVICGLLFLAATLNYVDRQVIGFLKPTLQQEFGWSEMDYADIVFAFQVAYAIGLLFAGRMMDKLGTRLGFSLAIIVWSIAATPGPNHVASACAIAARLHKTMATVKPRRVPSLSIIRPANSRPIAYATWNAKTMSA